MRVAMLHIRKHYAKRPTGFATRAKQAPGPTPAPDFREPPQGEVPGITLPRTPRVDRGRGGPEWCAETLSLMYPTWAVRGAAPTCGA